MRKFKKIKKINFKYAGKLFFATFLLFSILFLNLEIPFFAYAADSPWTQTDWSGGSGQTAWSDTTKYSTSSNITDSTAGQATLSPTSAWCNNASCNSSWKYRRKITFANTDANLGVTSESLVNFPVLVKLSSSNINYSNTQNSGQDIRFTDTDGSDLAYEIETWDETGTSWVWVKVPQIDINSSTDYIYIYYGNTAASDHQQATSTWNSNYAGVWHLKEDPSITAPQMQESTSNNLDLTSNGSMTSEDQISGQLAGSIDLDGSNDYLSVSDNTALKPTNITVSAWIKPSNPLSSYQMVVSKQPDAGNAAYTLRLNNSTGKVLFRASGTSTQDLLGTTVLQAGNWYHIVGVFDGSNKKIYINGVQDATHSVTGSITYDTTPLSIGRRGDGFYYIGQVDEVRISNTGHTAAWIAANYKSETDAFNTFNPEEERYASSGTLTSSIFDSEQQSNWGTLTYNTDGVATTTVKARTSNSSSMTGATDFASCNTITSGTDISSNNCVTDTHRYIQYQISLTSSSANTPTFQDISIVFTASDSTAPSISLTALTPDPNNDNTPSLSGTATDAAGTVSNVQFQMDSTAGSWTACTADDATFNSATEAFTCSVSSTLSDGSHTIYVRATDSNSNTTSNENATTDAFTIDTTAPSSGTITFTDGYYTTASVALTVDDGTDSGSGINTATRTVQSKSATLSAGSCGSFGSFSTVSVSGTYPNFTDTSVSSNNCYQYRYLVSDNAGNQTISTSANTAKIDATAPSSVGPPTFGTISTSSIIINIPVTVTEDGSGLYQWQVRRNSATELGFTAIATTSVTDSSLSENTQYTYDVQFKDNVSNNSSYGTSAQKYTLVDTPSGFTGIARQSTVILSVDSFPNDTAGSSGYYFSRSDANSGWIQTNSWSDSGLSCNTSYDYSVKYRNGDGTETSTISLVEYTTPCSSGGGGGSGGGSGGGGLTSPPDTVINEPQEIVQLPPPEPETVPSDKSSTEIILETIPKILQPLIPEFLKPKQPEEPPQIVIKDLVPKVAPLAFQGKWQLLPSEPIKEFVLASLPNAVKNLAKKFPDLEKTLKEVGISKITDIAKLKMVKLNLPGLTERIGLSIAKIKPGKFILPQGIPLAKLSPAVKQQMPTEIVFAKTGGELIDFNIDLSISEKGEPQQKIATISGKPLQLVVKPDKPVKSVKGYMVFKSKLSQPSSLLDIPLNSLLASLVFANPVFAKTQDQPVRVEEKLVLLEFEYTDPDGDGIYTAEIQAPLVAGEYDIITVMDFNDPELGKKEIRLTTVIDPEGYVFERDGNKETRIPGAIISLYWLNSETKQYELWPAGEYQQENPQTTDVRGTYSFLVPEGYYYLKAETPGYLIYDGKPFQVKEGSGVHINIELKTKYWWLSIVDWKTILLIAIIILLLYNFYRDKIREKLIRKS